MQWAGALRRELSARNQQIASTHGSVHELTTSEMPSVIFGRTENRQHGNFHPASFRNICANPQWQRRLAKVHSASRKASPRAGRRWRELDCANSSDALAHEYLLLQAQAREPGFECHAVAATGLPNDCKIALGHQFAMKRSWTLLGYGKYTQPTMRSLSSTDLIPNSSETAISRPAQQNQGSSCSVSGKVLDVRDLAEIFKCSREKIKRMARRGNLPAFKFGKHWYVRQDDLEHFLADQIQSGCHLRRDQENRE